jgi:hypothetical protein
LNIHSVFECIHSVFECIFNIFMVYFNAFIVCFNLIHYISMCLNVDILIGILLSHFHFNFFTMHTHLHIFFSTLHNDFIPNMLYYWYYIIFFHSHWFVPTFIQSMKKIHINPYFTFIHHPTFHIPNSMLSLVVRSITEPKFFTHFVTDRNNAFKIQFYFIYCDISWNIENYSKSVDPSHDSSISIICK